MTNASAYLLLLWCRLLLIAVLNLPDALSFSATIYSEDYHATSSSFRASLFLPPLKPGSFSVVVLSFKWSKTRQVMEKIDVPNTAPAAAMIPQNKNFQRNVRVNDPVGARDPNLDTIDGRSAAIEKNVQESRTTTT